MIASANQIDKLLGDCGAGSPFLLANEAEYQAWRARKLEQRAALAPTRLFRLADDGSFPAALLPAALAQVEAHNFLLFESAQALDKRALLALNRQFGLERLDQNAGADGDGVTALRVVDANDARAQYIPYTNRALNWHTDGYYNPGDRRINAFVLYCVHPAARGGGNTLLDHEYLYLQVRDRAPELLAALMRPDMLRIPANVQGNQILRGEESGPVFALEPRGCGLHMRYTSRPRNIVWKSDEASTRALDLVREILTRGDAAVEIDLRARQGLICNNLLHGRQAFHDQTEQAPRLVYRARYHDAIRILPAAGCAEDA